MGWILLASVAGGSGVLAGAYGAHGLPESLSAAQVQSWATAAGYQIVHSVVLLALGLFARAAGRRVHLQAGLFAAGILLFSGSIYGLVLGGASWLGPLTPLGGLLLVGGWASCLALARD